jgi:hypothetical protein
MNKKYKAKVHTVDEPKKCDYCNELKVKFKTGKKCYDCDLKFAREYKKQNAEKVAAKKKEWNKKNKEKIREQRKEYVKRNKKNYAVYMSYRRRHIKFVQMRDKHSLTFSTILSNRYDKYSKEVKEKIIKWFEFNFTDYMDWNNHGTDWHIDHVLPISKFKFEDDLDATICFDWKNCVPLDKTENLVKNNKIKPWNVFLLEYKLRQFGELNDCSEEIDEYFEDFTPYFNQMYLE